MKQLKWKTITIHIKENEEIESERNHEEKHGFLNFYGSLLKMSQSLKSKENQGIN